MLKAVGPYLAGGLGGAVLTAIVTSYRSRVQPVGVRITHSNMLNETAVKAGFPVTLVLDEKGPAVQVFAPDVERGCRYE